jgi:hypothetical protein
MNNVVGIKMQGGFNDYRHASSSGMTDPLLTRDTSEFFFYIPSDFFAAISRDVTINISMLPAKSPVKNRSIEITSCKKFHQIQRKMNLTSRILICFEAAF